MAGVGTSTSTRRRGKGTEPTGPTPGDKPRALEHYCSPCKLVAKGDERDCRACSVERNGREWMNAGMVARERFEALLAEAVAEVRAKARGARPDPRLRGAGAREMGRLDLNGKPWGYKPVTSYIRGWNPRRRR